MNINVGFYPFVCSIDNDEGSYGYDSYLLKKLLQVC